MATAIKSQKERQDEIYGAGKKELDAQRVGRDETDEQYITQANEINNTAAQKVEDKYRQLIDKAPVASRALYDANALDEAISQKKIQESMANMGLTDSGLTSSMQTALALQKSRADAGVRRQEREYVQGLENAIADMWAQTEAANAQNALSVRKGTADWYNQSLADIYNSSITGGATTYAADVEAKTAADKIKADTEMASAKATTALQNNIATATANFIKEGYDPATAQQMAYWMYGVDTGTAVNPAMWRKSEDESAAKLRDKKAEAVQGFMEDDYDFLTSSVLAAQLYGGTGNEEQDRWADSYTKAISLGYNQTDAILYANAGGGAAGENAIADHALKTASSIVEQLGVSGIDVTSGWIFSKSFWNSPVGDGREDVAPKVKELLGNELCQNLTPTEKEYTAGLMVAELVHKAWESTDEGNEKKNITRIEEACKELGIDPAGALARYNELRIMR